MDIIGGGALFCLTQVPRICILTFFRWFWYGTTTIDQCSVNFTDCVSSPVNKFNTNSTNMLQDITKREEKRMRWKTSTTEVLKLSFHIPNDCLCTPWIAHKFGEWCYRPGLENSFCKEPYGKYLRLCMLYNLYCKYVSLPL